MAPYRNDNGDGEDPLAYGECYDKVESERGSTGIGNTFRRFASKLQDPPDKRRPSSSEKNTTSSGMQSIFSSAATYIGSEIKKNFSGQEDTSHGHSDSSQGLQQHTEHRFRSFAPQREGNKAKWYVDACGYMWAVSIALENAHSSIWILDWWLSPELYLRRPPAKNEKYRVDRMLAAAANRGVKVNIIVYKEVTQALTLSSAHTKHHLEDLHPNIAVFRHPDHLPDRQNLASDFMNAISNLSLDASTASKLPGDTLNAIYGVHEGTVLFWAHHEKLCIIDGDIAFMGGLDLCYGRWDSNQHSIADYHPDDSSRVIFPGQDYNNARIMDFQDPPNWEKNKLDRSEYPRMGWSDVSFCLSGPVVGDLQSHFVQRWNFIYEEKYKVRKNSRFSRLELSRDPHHGLLDAGKEKLRKTFREHVDRHGHHEHEEHHSGVSCQIARSCAKWSHATMTEHSIATAYIEVIKNSQHFVYIENQFFITATGNKQKPVKNMIGAAIVERIIRAARNNEKYMVFVVIPAIPAFPGELKSEEALSTRAIMEFQYESINRGGNSIMEKLAAAGVDPMNYIRFFNLRSYDRISTNRRENAPDYEDHFARKRWDSVSECYMLEGEDIRNVPWEGEPSEELPAFVSELLYVHSKLLIADDRVVIGGSANINDRSQLGNHDSEIVVVIEDPSSVDSSMNGRRWRASKFAASLRRQIFRKHIGLLKSQDVQRPDQNFRPIGVPNEYDWGSTEDQMVADPLSDEFLELWYYRAKTNTDAFARVFHPVPFDGVHNWNDYSNHFEKYFCAEKKEGEDEVPSKYKYGHVVAENFPDGQEGVREVKKVLSHIKGTLVEMPLLFLKEEDIAQEGLTLNAFTKEVYT